MSERSTIHQVAYYAQWESPDLVPDFIAGTRSVRDDPLWQKSGAADRDEYAFWADRTCGIACLRMALDHFGEHVPPVMELVSELSDAGAYVRDGDTVHGLVYRPFAEYVTRRWTALTATIHTDLDETEIADAVHAGSLVVISVHKTIRTLPPEPPSRGGHLVLSVGADTEALYINNPSGLPGHSQHAHRVPWADLPRFYARRGVVLSHTKEPVR
ncbi:C39 family peptidase [Streptomyces sp. CC208A]|uniref:C39 family peptidase n=1 Tax=Streptomyces sp. CC208A TaxID=3044573 RepID=UPI0024A7EA4F|nr:C39 family peptidase [Streptomyces sp. CC208A]